MAIIGTFNKFEDGKYYGTLSTLTFETEAVIEPAKKHGDKSPDFRITNGAAEIGAAWKRSDKGKEQLSVRLDDPSFAAPVNCRLTASNIDGTFNLIWQRDRKRS